MSASALGLYRPGSSLLHRAPAGFKLAALILAGAGVLALGPWWQVAAALGLVACLYASAGFGPRIVWSQLRPVVPFLIVIALFQAVVDGPGRAAEIVLGLAGLVLLAGLLTLTTRASEMAGVVERGVSPLARLGVDPARVGLMIALGTRAVPIVVSLAEQVRKAQLARGLGASPRAFAVPLIVRSLRRSDAMAEALVARGALDQPGEPQTPS